MSGAVPSAQAGWSSWMDEWANVKTDRPQRPAVVSLGAGRLDVMWLEGNNTLRHRTWNNGWSEARVVTPPSHVPRFDGGVGCGTWSAPLIFCFARAGGWLWQMTFDGAQWTFHPLGVPNVGSDVSVTSWTTAHLDLLWTNPQGSLIHKSFYQPAGGWLPETDRGSPGGGFVGSPGCASWAFGRLDCFMRGRDQRLYQKVAINVWQPGFNQLFGVTVTGSPTAAAWGPNHLDVMFPGLDGNGNQVIWTAWWVGGWGIGALSGDWNLLWDSAGLSSRSEPACVSWGVNRIDCFVIPDVDGQRSVHHTFFTPWVHGYEPLPAPNSGTIETTKVSLLNKFAPRLKFHENEDAMPTTVEDVLATASLKFRQQSGAISELVPKGQLTPSALGERRTMGVNGSSTPQQPSDRPSDDPDAYFFVDIDPSTHPGTSWLRFPNWNDRLRIYGHADRIIKNGAAVGFELQYYILFAKDSGSPDAPINDPYRHEGDWEIFKVKTDLRGNFQRAIFYGHGHKTDDSSTVALRWANARGVERSGGTLGDFTHPVVFVSQGKHALYATAGSRPTQLAGLIADHTSDRGVSWDSVNKVVPLDSPFAPGGLGAAWANFAGRWGDTYRSVPKVDKPAWYDYVGAGVAAVVLPPLAPAFFIDDVGFKAVTSPEGPAARGAYCQSLMEEGITLESCLPRCGSDHLLNTSWVALYQHRGFQGAYEVHQKHFLGAPEPEFENYLGLLNWNDKTSSIRWCLVPGVSYTLFENVFYQGSKITLTGAGSCSNLAECAGVAKGWDERISSSRF